jgi:hypothetical protein
VSVRPHHLRVPPTPPPADALALCLAHVAALASVLSPRFSLEMHCLLPVTFCVGALGLVVCSELAWTGALAAKPVMYSFMEHRGAVAALFGTAFKVRRHQWFRQANPPGII